MTKYFVNSLGVYIGGFDGALPPAGAVEVPSPPANAADRWNDGQWAPAAAESPESVPMLNLQLVLIDDGKLDTVEAIIKAATGADGAKARAYWAKAQTARRDNFLVEQLWPAIGYTETTFNDAWARAAALKP